MGKKAEIGESELRKLYEEEKLTYDQIAARQGFTRKTIAKIMQRFGIPRRHQPRVEFERACENCGVRTTNPKFCSSRCAAIYNNTNFPKRKKLVLEWICIECGKPTTERRKYCNDCLPNQIDWMSRTLAELTTDGYDQTYRIVRSLARRIYKESGLPLECRVCGYSEHYEICHIRAIRKFPKNTLIREVNRLDNLVALCPNHHWELDNGRLKLPK